MLSLAPYAANEKNSLGRHIPEEAPSYRSEFQRDRDRIVHSAAFRRLEYKTQVFVNHEGDMFRTRLTHSIEVAQISRSIARILNINEDLSETIALAHDLGHTPFGHAGQDALNDCMKEYGGFEHNLQSLRTVDKLEQRYADFEGLNLTFEAREGILKHCSLRHARELGEVGRRFIDKTQPSLEAQAVNLADEIAYNNHDVDDGLRSGLITLAELEEIELFNDQYREVRERYRELTDRRLIHEIIRRMINRQIIDLVETSQAAIEVLAPQKIDDVRRHSQSLIGFSDEMRAANMALKQFLRSRLYSHYRVHRMTSKAQRIIESLFSAFFQDPRLLQPKHQQKVYTMEEKEGTNGRARAVADYIAGMTDRYAIAEYGRIFDPAELT
ncbi:deoxyguanosinetriphosphate triphosphohydrolase [Thiohalophilus sp.]|uniref:deoxyguanosinetriphosphate triphosphohydrolase n=1 Tax=Thiohalophilus sp. TaxID=3028392 RepID=UPI002ACD5712|nr:deoxyguanosinetriphosphate triphosphohydrolase [Thiohalophilus sp.]MDZ7661611.1 deoxyguanosinetriphosphate triphosphohydrolase [Thiohalophilus sp.]MDZ7803582.1 deoxyguanosinetriphosphate triphosphohydrolase [Thiohalophilus sp.]